MAEHVIAVALDEVLLDHVGDVNPANRESCRDGVKPNKLTFQRVHDLVELGHEVHVLAVRHPGLQGLTVLQAHQWVSPKIDRWQVHVSPSWDDMTAQCKWFETQLRAIGAEVLVGARPVHEIAAGHAGVPYLDVADYRRGKSVLELVGEPTCVRCSCADDRACPGGCSWVTRKPALCSSCAAVPAGVDVALVLAARGFPCRRP